MAVPARAQFVDMMFELWDEEGVGLLSRARCPSTRLTRAADVHARAPRALSFPAVAPCSRLAYLRAVQHESNRHF
eukprot:5712122-Pleurochrysis_carterae.AAC.1